MKAVKNKIKLLKMIRKNFEISYRNNDSIFTPILWQVRNKNTGLLSEELKSLREALLYCTCAVVGTHEYLRLRDYRREKQQQRGRELINSQHTKLF